MKKTVCGMCQSGCRVMVEEEKGRITKVMPDRDVPGARICMRGALAPEMLYGEQRIKKPLIREGERGEGKFREAAWDEAFSYAAELIRKTADTYGARSLVSYFGRGVLGTPVFRFAVPGSHRMLFERLGSPNDTTCSSICNLSYSTIVPNLTIGFQKRFLFEDIEHSDYILLWGKNPLKYDGPRDFKERIKAARERGAKVVAVDPRGYAFAKDADLWYGVTPGSDGALALFMLKQIVEEERYDHAFVEHYVRGFAEFEQYLRNLKYEDLADGCGLSMEEIRSFTDLFCSTEKICIFLDTGLEYSKNAVQSGRAIYTLFAITGKLDVEGGMYIDGEGIAPYAMFDAPDPDGDLPLGYAEYPLFYRHNGTGQFIGFQKAVLEDDPYPARGLFLAGGSPLLTFPDSERMREAYKKLECLIVADRFYTEDALYADVVFPAAAFYECPSLRADAHGNRIVAEADVPPAGEARSDVLIVTGILEKLGVRNADEPLTEEELSKWLAETKVPYAMWAVKKDLSKKKFCFRKYESGKLRTDGKPGFPTPSGKFEICSSILEEYGYTPYPIWENVRDIEGFDTKSYPYMLTTGARSENRMGVLGANIPRIAGVEPSPCVDMDAADADAAGLADGDYARVTTPFGSAVFKVRSTKMARHCIHIPHGGGSAAMNADWREGNVNKLTGAAYCDPLSGFAMIKSLPARVEKVR